MPTTDLPLKDIHLPAAIEWWPPALGWWLVLILGLAVLVGAIWLVHRAMRKTALKSAKKLLLALQRNQDLNELQQLTELSMLLRRTSISLYPRSDTASLTGDAWLKFLDRSMQGKPFSEGVGQCLKDAHYRKFAPGTLELSELYRLCSDWLNAQARASSSHQRKK